MFKRFKVLQPKIKKPKFKVIQVQSSGKFIPCFTKNGTWYYPVYFTTIPPDSFRLDNLDKVYERCKEEVEVDTVIEAIERLIEYCSFEEGSSKERYTKVLSFDSMDEMVEFYNGLEPEDG